MRLAFDVVYVIEIIALEIVIEIHLDIEAEFAVAFLRELASGIQATKKHDVRGGRVSSCLVLYHPLAFLEGQMRNAQIQKGLIEHVLVRACQFLGNERYFVYIAAFGAFTEVSYSTPQDIKNLLGHQAYILESIKALGNLKSYKMHVAWDHGEADGEFIFGMVTNTTSVGGFSGLAPKDVSFHDGLFEGVFIRTPKSPVDLPNILSGLLLFPEQENKDVIRVKSSKFTVTAEEEVPWALDGEFGGSVTEARIENVKEAVTLSCSPEPEKCEEKTEK